MRSALLSPHTDNTTMTLLSPRSALNHALHHPSNSTDLGQTCTLAVPREGDWSGTSHPAALTGSVDLEKEEGNFCGGLLFMKRIIPISLLLPAADQACQ